MTIWLQGLVSWSVSTPGRCGKKLSEPTTFAEMAAAARKRRMAQKNQRMNRILACMIIAFAISMLPTILYNFLRDWDQLVPPSLPHSLLSVLQRSLCSPPLSRNRIPTHSGSLLPLGVHHHQQPFLYALLNLRSASFSAPLRQKKEPGGKLVGGSSGYDCGRAGRRQGKQSASAEGTRQEEGEACLVRHPGGDEVVLQKVTLLAV